MRETYCQVVALLLEQNPPLEQERSQEFFEGVSAHAQIFDHAHISQTQRASHSGAAAQCSYAKFGTIVRLRAKPFSTAFFDENK